jgi:hypothetical protein
MDSPQSASVANMFDELIRRRAQVFPDIANNIQQQNPATANNPVAVI